MHETPPETGKTPNMPVQAADLAAAVDEGNWEVQCGSTPSLGLHVSFIN